MGKAKRYSPTSAWSRENPTDGVSASYINAACEDDQMEIVGYQRSTFRIIMTWSLICLTFGILRVIYHWFPEFLLKSTHVKCSLQVAEKVLIVEIYEKKHRRVYIRSISHFTNKILDANRMKKGTCSKRPKNEYVLQDRAFSLPSTNGTFHDADNFRMFSCKKLRYLWDTKGKTFVKVKGFGPGLPTSVFHQSDAQQGFAGLTTTEQLKRRFLYGPNLIHVPVKSVLELLLLQVLNPFYIFQVSAIIIWCMVENYYFAAAVFLMSATGVIISIIQTRKNQQNLQNTVHSSDVIDVCRGDGTFETIGTEDLVPGDVIIIPTSGCTMHCDAVILYGTCIVNESMLTGESVPVTKTPIPVQPDILYSLKEHGKHTLFNGTKVVQTRICCNNEKVMAVVTSTGYLTTKGSLVSAILYPPPVDFRFEKDSYKFIGFLVSLASVGFAYSLAKKIMAGEGGVKVIFHLLDIITVCVPPALPAVITAGIILAQKRLELRKIYCISPRSINVSGSLNCICFDKTGTLTEDELDLWGVVLARDDGSFLTPTRASSRLDKVFADQQQPSAATSINDESVSYSRCYSFRISDKLELPLMVMGMATCHSIATIDGVKCGDPLDVKMFESTNWILSESSVQNDDNVLSRISNDTVYSTTVTWEREMIIENKDEFSNGPQDSIGRNKIEVAIVHQFPFNSSLQRMAVICKLFLDDQSNHQYHFFCKGSPEMIKSLAKPETIPRDYDQVLERYASQGLRVISLAHRLIDIIPSVSETLNTIPREEFEREMTFIGLIIFENRLKLDTATIVKQLMEADIRTIMLTGDSLHTAISVANDCGMIKHNDQVITMNAEDSSSEWHSEKPKLTCTVLDSASVRQTSGKEITSPSSAIFDEDSVVNISHPEVEQSSTGRYHLAINGKSWSVIQGHYPELVPRCLVKGTIFARMSPDQKQNLVQELQKLDYVVGMCGDGANDCGALKAAHVGIALADSEASVASPFTSKDSSISCVPELIRQGRCALVTSFGIFKYMAVYSLIQFISVMILYEVGTTLSPFQYLYIDFFIICSLMAVFGHSKPYPGPLFDRPPLTSLISPLPIASLLIQVIAIGCIQGISLFALNQQEWFVPYMDTHNETALTSGEYACHENYTLFGVSLCQYIFMALAYAKGKPYKEMFIKNYLFLGAILMCTAFSLLLLVEPNEAIQSWFELEMPPMNFRLIILGLSLVQVVLCLLLEEFVVDLGLAKMIHSKMWLKFRPRREKYLAAEKEFENSNFDPTLSSFPLVFIKELFSKSYLN